MSLRPRVSRRVVEQSTAAAQLQPPRQKQQQSMRRLPQYAAWSPHIEGSSRQTPRFCESRAHRICLANRFRHFATRKDCRLRQRRLNTVDVA